MSDFIKIYKNDSANAVFFEDSNGTQFLNTLLARREDHDNDLISIKDINTSIDLVTSVHYTNFIDEYENVYGANSLEVYNKLNTEFNATGNFGQEPPVITSSLNINLTKGETLSYEVTADYGVSYEWDLSNVPGVVQKNGNLRKILGGSNLDVGTYSIPVRAINYNGFDLQIITLTVSEPPFSNTKSIKFSNGQWMGGNAALITQLERSGNGSGSSDAFFISFYFKASSANQGQTILYFGSNDVANGGHIELKQTNHNGLKRLRFKYGSNNNFIQLTTPSGSITPNVWQKIHIWYLGGSTGSSSGNILNYYNQFGIAIDNVAQSTNNTHSNYGYSGSIVGQNFRLGRYVSGNYMRDNAKIDELAIWGSDQTSNSNLIFNNGIPFDLMTLTEKPDHWWRMADGDVFPYAQDSGLDANCILECKSMNIENFTSDVPT